MKKKRWLQYLTNIHRIHHITWSYGYTLKPFRVGYFDEYGFKRIKRSEYHDCTSTGIY